MPAGRTTQYNVSQVGESVEIEEINELPLVNPLCIFQHLEINDKNWDYLIKSKQHKRVLRPRLEAQLKRLMINLNKVKAQLAQRAKLDSVAKEIVTLENLVRDLSCLRSIPKFQHVPQDLERLRDTMKKDADAGVPEKRELERQRDWLCRRISTTFAHLWCCTPVNEINQLAQRYRKFCGVSEDSIRQARENQSASFIAIHMM